MDDVAEDHDFARLVIALQFSEARERVIRRRHRHQLSAQTMRPGVAEMKIGDRENALLREPGGATGIEGEVVVEVESHRRKHQTSNFKHQTSAETPNIKHRSQRT